MSTQQTTPPQELLELVARFEEHADAYRSGQYNETQVRREFIDPLFALLGWDMENRSNYAEQYKDVIHEDAIRIGSLTKAPDYCFRIGGTRKFFVEAKKPSVNIREDISAAYQVRRYAWSAKLPLSILCDFDEFAVYDCRKRPEKGDSPSVGRILYMTYNEYPRRWGEIASVFSRETILRGSFDKFAETTKGKRGTAEVDDAFLKEIESWRDALARNLALRNPALTQRELNFAVGRTIDRIIFLRICEDRGIEPYGQLEGLLNGQRVYPRLCDIFDRADDHYNSGLFHFQPENDRPEAPDELSKRLTLDDKTLKDIIKRLYYPESPYEFSVLPADILGQVYEQFLGKVIRLTAGHQAKVEEKPEVKKAGGVYYTPTYIVDYIVGNTVGKLLANKTPKKASELRILDPACGSGSFLIGAYQYLLDWHLKYYLDNSPEKHARGRNPALVRTAAGWRLTTTERKRILTNNIYGVDIDSQAVEVTKLSLLLKVLEGETEASLSAQMKMLERALPDLGGNIRCGNSLIGPDFYAGRQLSLLDEEEMYRINVFDWNGDTDGFGAIMKAGGFDAVIGNPPYVFGEYHDQGAKHYFGSCYACARGQFDTYWLFMERGAALTRKNGYFSFIVPDALLARDEAAAIRSTLLDSGLERIFHCGRVFRAAVSATVFVCHVGSQPQLIASDVPKRTEAVLEHQCTCARFLHDPARRLLVHATDAEAAMLGRIASVCAVLSKLVSISRGEELGKSKLGNSGSIGILVGEDVMPYTVRSPSRFVSALTKDVYAGPKIVVVKTGDTCVAALESSGCATMQSLYNLHVIDDGVSILALLGLLNSRFARYFIRTTFTDYKGLFPQMNQSTLGAVPIPDVADNRLSALAGAVERMLDLQRRLPAANLDQEKTVLKRRIEATDRQIDELVYELYGLTEDEIALVENAK